MPWKNEGGGWPGGGRGPWGQGPQGPSGGGRGTGGVPPDLDDLIRRVQDALRNLMPGSGRGTLLIPLILFLAVAVYNSIYQVQADERGVVLRFGQYTRTVGPGLHFAVWPVEKMETPKVEAENQTTFGTNEADGLMLAGDQNIIDMRFTVLWKIKDPQAFLFNVRDQENVVRAVTESAMREIVGRTPAEEIRTTGRQVAQDQVLAITQATLDGYGAGVLITAVKLEKADPPGPVLDAFEEVQRAEQNQARSINEADQYANQRLRLAEGEAAKLIEDAKAYKARVVFEARGEAQRFLSVLNEYAKAKDVTRQRIYLETLEDVLGQSNKVLMPGGEGQNVVPYLPLPEIQKRQNDQAPANPPAAALSQGDVQP